jgi:hypothetical protein
LNLATRRWSDWSAAAVLATLFTASNADYDQRRSCCHHRHQDTGEIVSGGMRRLFQ